MPIAANERLFAYEPGNFFDEAVDPMGRPRPGYERVLDALAHFEPGALSERVDSAMQRIGATFGDGADAFPVCPIPRLIPANEWALLERGLAQRARALNAFITDVYGDQEIVCAGVIGKHVITGADHFEPAMIAMPQPGGPAPIVGFDLVRGMDGSLRVLEDNLRTPSGLAYAAAVRRAVETQFPLSARRRPELDPSFQPLQRVLAEAAGGLENPWIALLSDGPSNSAWWEHRTLARRLGISLVTPEKLRLSRGRLCVALPSGRLRPLDVVYRRTDEDRLRDERGHPTWLAEMLLEPLQRGVLGVVNQPGTGVADDKLVHAYVEEMIRFYLREEPLIESVRTYDLTRPDVLTKVLGRLSALVVKPRTGHGGNGVVIGAHASREERTRVASLLKAAPHRFVAQEMVRLSRLPTVVDGRVEPRHVDLRVFSLGAGDRPVVMPTPLTRVALRSGSMIVNSSQGGGAKDTWIIDDD
ncbi:MAG TPA: circularly permuted type 2 ATP-grasp protein [Thermoleophilaceae bacterium]